jgi:regulator of cell morphogenesis and NO signaling
MPPDSIANPNWRQAMVSTNRTLGDLVAAIPSAAKVMQRHRLDYCCGGQQTLEAACAAGDLDTGTVLRELADAEASSKDGGRWAQRPIDELITHILDRYHAPLRQELPRLVELARRVERVHAEKPDCPTGLAELLAEVRAAVDNHLTKEEQILFPLILSGRGHNAYMPIQVMMEEHEDHGSNLRRIRALTQDLRLPDSACASWRELYRALGELEAELMDHIHLENSILFPRALAA